VLRALAFHANHGPKLPQYRDQMKATVVYEIERGANVKPQEMEQADRLRNELCARLDQFLTRYDFLVLPTTQVPAFDIELEYVREIEGVAMESYIDWMRSCYFITVTGLPAISIPAGFTPAGLPVGIQIVGRHRDDFGVLQIAHAFEGALGLQPRFPPIALA